MAAGLSLYGTGSGASPLVTGFHSAHHELEVQLADWLGYDRALLFSSGFSANQALLFTLLKKDDVLIQDKLNHASLMEAGLLSPATMRRFPHNDTTALHRALLRCHQSPSEAASMVVTEGVFSMDGDLSPLAEMKTLCAKHNSWLVVDDAHGCGVLGSRVAEAAIRPVSRPTFWLSPLARRSACKGRQYCAARKRRIT